MDVYPPELPPTPVERELSESTRGSKRFNVSDWCGPLVVFDEDVPYVLEVLLVVFGGLFPCVEEAAPVIPPNAVDRSLSEVTER